MTRFFLLAVFTFSIFGCYGTSPPGDSDSLLLTHTVDDRVIHIPLKLDAKMITTHPVVEGMVHEEIG